MDLVREFFAETAKPYSVTAEVSANGGVVDFEVYEGSLPHPSMTPAIKGSVKWDGCSNWHFTYPTYPLHFCSRNEATWFGEFMAGLYTWAAELMPEHKNNLGDEKK